jgi:type IV pilus assembly protein PilV
MNTTDKNKIVNDKKTSAGFTLPEVMVAMAIITIGLLAIGLQQISAINGNNRGKMTSQAATLAADQMERLLAFDYNDPELNDGDYNRPEGAYAITWTIGAGATANVKTITVAVTSENPHLLERNVTLNGLKSRSI